MFDHFLTCSSFWLPGDGSAQYLGVAREWSGQESLGPVSGKSVRWEQQTRVKIGGQSWFSTPPGFDLTAQQALVPLGSLGDVQTFAFVSPFSSVSASFKMSVVDYLKARNISVTGSQGLVLDINRFSKESWEQRVSEIRILEGVDDGVSLIVAGRLGNSVPFEGLPPPRTLDLKAITIEIFGRRAKVYTDFSIEIDDVSSEFDDISASLTGLFEIFQNYLKVRQPNARPMTASRHER